MFTLGYFIFSFTSLKRGSERKGRNKCKYYFLLFSLISHMSKTLKPFISISLKNLDLVAQSFILVLLLYVKLYFPENIIFTEEHFTRHLNFLEWQCLRKPLISYPFRHTCNFRGVIMCFCSILIVYVCLKHICFYCQSSCFTVYPIQSYLSHMEEG